jgi:hypothetical protein
VDIAHGLRIADQNRVYYRVSVTSHDPDRRYRRRLRRHRRRDAGQTNRLRRAGQQNGKVFIWIERWAMPPEGRAAATRSSAIQSSGLRLEALILMPDGYRYKINECAVPTE